MRSHRTRVRVVGALTGLALAGAIPGPVAQAASDADSFYRYTGSKPLSSYRPGDILKTRTVPYHVAGISTPIKAVQMLYRGTDAQGRPTANVTSVLKPPGGSKSVKAVSYQSAYDSLDPKDGPSRAIAGDVSLGGIINQVESVIFAPLLLKGYTVVVPDTEGQQANFAAGPEYGTHTLDSIRAVTRSKSTAVNSSTKVGLLGYSGGAIASSWASIRAPQYAPEVNKRLVGVAQGGVLATPAHNLKYVDGSVAWSGVAAMAIIGVARAYDIDFTPYLNDYGRKVVTKLDDASIVNVLGQYPGLTWKKLVKPEYENPRTVPEYVDVVNKINMGQAPSPTIPNYIVQGTGGEAEGTPGNKPGVGSGDGVMVSGDVRTLARKHCAAGVPVVHREYPLSHVGAMLPWAPAALSWLDQRFAGKAAPSNCDQIKPGNSLDPEPHE